MTEKEYKKIISEIELSTNKKEMFNQISSQFQDIINQVKNPFVIGEIKKIGIIQSQMAIEKTDYLELIVNGKVDSNINESYNKTLLINEILKELLLTTEVKSYEINQNQLKIKLNNLVITLFICDDNQFNLEIKRLKFIEELNQKYTLFKNAFKLIRHLLDELNIDLFNDYTLMVLLAYAMERHYIDNKYDNYMVAFSSGLDDLINSKKIELNGEYQTVNLEITNLTKGYVIVDPFNANNNLGLNLNDANIGEVRKLKKRISKLYDQASTDTGSSSILTLNINPITNQNGTICWNYVVVGRNIQNSGGEFSNTLIENKNASLKALFRGLKAIVNSNIYNKNITVITKHKDLLKCVEKDQSEADNNSRRKTIVKYIEDNKLLVNFQIKE